MKNLSYIIILLFPLIFNSKNENLDTKNSSVLTPKAIKNKELWDKAKIVSYYSMGEKYKVKETCESEKKWLDSKIKIIIKDGFPNSEIKQNDMNWNPSNDLYFFLFIPNENGNKKYNDYEKTIEILINGIDVTYSLYSEIETGKGSLLYYKLPLWFWNLEIIKSKLSTKTIKKIYGENYKENGPPYVMQDGSLEGFTTKVNRVYTLIDSEDEDKIIKTVRKLLVKNTFICAFGE